MNFLNYNKFTFNSLGSHGNFSYASFMSFSYKFKAWLYAFRHSELHMLSQASSIFGQAPEFMAYT